MSSKKRSRSVSRDQYFNHESLHALDDNSTTEACPRGNSNRERPPSLSRAPTAREPLNRDTKKARASEPKGRFPATFEILADPHLQSPSQVRTPPSKPAKGILKNSSSPIRPSTPSFITETPITASSRSSQTQRPFGLRSFPSLYFSPIFKNRTPARSSPPKQYPTPASQTTTMSGKGSGKAKARDATAVYNLSQGSSTEKNKKSVPVNGSAFKKANDTSDEGSSSSDEESSESSESSDEESAASDNESNEPEKTAAPATGNKKPAAAPASESSDSESDSSDESDDDTSKEKAKNPAAVAPAATNGATESSEEEDSDSEAESGGAKVAPADEVPDSSPESSEEEDSDEEMDDAPPSGQDQSNTPKSSGTGALKAAQRGPPEPAPSVLDGGFKLQKAQNLGQMASLLSEANAKGDRVWLLTHPSTTPLNLEVQKVFTSPENHRNSIVPNGTKLTYPVASDGNNIHTITGCDSITVTQTMRNDADISSLAQVMSDVRHAKEAPVQPSGLRTRYLPIGVGRASPTLEDSPPRSQPRASEKAKKDKKKKDRKEDVPSSRSEPSSERPSKKRKVAAGDETESSEAAVKGKSKAEGSSQPTASSQAEPDTEKLKKKKKSKAQEAEAEETPAKTKKPKVKFAAEEQRSSTPIPPPSIPSSQLQESPSKKSKKKRRLSEGEPEPEKKPDKKDKKDKKESTWARPEEVKVTPVAPPNVPGMR